MAGGHHLLIASNRGPVSLVVRDGATEVTRGGGGLVSGMRSALADAGGLWVCSALSEHERSVARDLRGAYLGSHGLDTGGLDVRMLPIDASVFERAYNGIANSTLWFVNHLLYDYPTTPVFDATWRRQWGAYELYNRAFAEVLAEEAAEAATVMVQDYHLFLVPAMLRERRPDLAIGHFTHTPWAPPANFAVLPDRVVREVLGGLLGADHLGFHCDRWAEAFLECCARLLGATVEGSTGGGSTGGGSSTVGGSTVEYAGRRTRVGVHPLGTDGAALRERGAAPDVNQRVERLREQVGGLRVIGRVDRTELSKNIVRGLLAYRELLHTYPRWREAVAHVVYTYPSRHDLPEYREYTAAVQRVGRQIEDEFGTDGWTPLVLEIANDYPGSLATLRASDVLLVNPVRDGMNLVAQEGVLLSDAGCALVLSREAGAIDMLGPHALVVNPFDISETARALHDALSMSDGERRARARAMAHAATALPPTAWFAQQLDAVRG